MEKTANKERDPKLMIRGWFLLITVVGGICLYQLASVGEASLHSVLLGYSASRLGMMAVLLLCTGISAAGLIDPGEKFTAFVRQISLNKTAKAAAAALFLLLSLLWVTGGFMSDIKFQPFFLRLRPLLIFGMAVCGSGSLLLFRLSMNIAAEDPEGADIRRTAVTYFYIAFSLYVMIRLTGLGIIPDEMDWQPNGMAIQYWEICLSLWIALTLTLLLRLIHAFRRPALTTVLLFFAIWIGTAVLWVSIPSMDVLDHSYFMEITEPNNLPYPASDSAYYGLWANSVLAGLGFKSTVVTRQFFITVIAFFDALTGQDILKTIDCLTILLALIPACIYLLGKRLHSHGAGILAAGLAALREYNTILLAPHYMVSNSKMLLSDLPAMLCMLAVLCSAVNWFRKPRSVRYMLLTGFLTGLSVTVRSQFIILIPFLPLFFILQKGLPFKKRLMPAVCFILAAAAVIAPWLIRSKIISGEFILDEPGIHSTELARRWSDDVDNVVERGPDETEAEYAARNSRHMIEFFLEKPLYVMQFAASHFFANELCALTALPFGTDPGLTIHDVTDTGFHDVEGRMLDPRNVPMLMVFLILISLGMSAARNRTGAAGLLPFVTCSLYLLLTAFGRYSGWRFALPADWFCYFYAAVGTAEIAYQVSAFIDEKYRHQLTVQPADTGKQHSSPAAVVLLSVLFLILGCAPALSRKVIPQQVSMRSDAENTAGLNELFAEDPEKLRQISDMAASDNVSVLNGRIIYPRFFYADRGLASGHPWTAYKIRDYSRLGFVLLNEENHDVILPVEEPPAYIPNAADIYVIGRDNGEFFMADAVIIPNAGSSDSPRILAAEPKE